MGNESVLVKDMHAYTFVLKDHCVYCHIAVISTSALNVRVLHRWPSFSFYVTRVFVKVSLTNKQLVCALSVVKFFSYKDLKISVF
jgi:hypothetical protein